MHVRRREEDRTASFAERASDRVTAFAGSMTFVAIHAVFYGLWITANLGWLPVIPKFDPSFVVLAMEASVEAIFLSTFVLISQNRMMAAAARQADLDLQVNLLAEHELTKLIALVESIATKVGLEIAMPELEEIKKDIAPEAVLDGIEADRQDQG